MRLRVFFQNGKKRRYAGELLTISVHLEKGGTLTSAPLQFVWVEGP